MRLMRQGEEFMSRLKGGKNKRGRPKKPPARGRIKNKVAFLVDNLLDDALESSITIEDLAAKAAILRSALDYLKLTKDDEELESDQNFFKIKEISPESLLEDMQDMKSEVENE